MSDTGWLSTVDARVLVDIQDGYVASSSGDRAGLTASVANWASLWNAVKSDQQTVEDADTINRLVAAAENGSIAVGRAEYDRLGRFATSGEAIGLVGANTFRLGQTYRPLLRSGLGSACAANPICGPFQALTGTGPAGLVNPIIDEHNGLVGYAGASGAFAQTYNPMLSPLAWLEVIIP
jgi:hypothetical protein